MQLRYIQSLVFSIFLFGIYAIAIYRVRWQGKVPHVRRIAALEAMRDGMGRALEMGGKVHCGMAGGGRSVTGDLLVAVAQLGYFARMAARTGVDAVYSCAYSPTLTLMQGVVRDAYVAEGKAADTQDPDKVDVVLAPTGESVYGYPYWVNHMIQRRNVAFTMQVGPQMVLETLMMGEGAVDAGAMSIVGYPAAGALMFCVSSYDYALMLQENFVTGAWLMDDKIQLGCVLGMDIVTWTMIILAFVLAGVATALGISWGTIITG